MMQDDPRQPAIVYSKGNGRSIETAVGISGAVSASDGVQAEIAWISKRYGAEDRGWRLVRQGLLESNGKWYDQLTIETSDRNTRNFIFDISNFYGK